MKGGLVMGSQKVRTKLSTKNDYHIPEYRRLELKYFCLQYGDYKEYLKTYHGRKGTSEWSDPTGEEAVKRRLYSSYIEVIEETARKTGGDISEYLLKAVTEDLSFVTLYNTYNIPCGRDYYYERYHKFWYMLSQKKHMF